MCPFFGPTLILQAVLRYTGFKSFILDYNISGEPSSQSTYAIMEKLKWECYRRISFLEILGWVSTKLQCKV